MKKIYLIIFTFISLNASNIYIAADNNNSLSFKKEMFYLWKSLNVNKKFFQENDIKNIVLFRESKKDRKYKIEENLPNKKSIYKIRTDNGIIDTLNKILTAKYNKGDTIIIVSALDYKERQTNTDSSNKIYNDAWIVSSKSPIKRLIDRYPNKPLNQAKVIIIDPNHNLKYLKYRTRFFSYLFEKLGGKLQFLGSLDNDKIRLTDYIKAKKELHKLYQFSPLKNENILMLDDSVIQYELP